MRRCPGNAHSELMSQPQSVPLDPGAPWVELTALELHPDGHRLRLTHAEYAGSAFYGPTLAELLPGATPIRRLSHEVFADEGGRHLRRAVWLLESDGHGDGWHTPARLPEDSQPWIQAALTPEPARRPHWQRRGGWAALLAWLDTELDAQGWARLAVPQVLKDGGISFLARVETTAGRVYLKTLPDFFRAEVGVTCALWHGLPGGAAPVLAADSVRHLLLLRDAGEPLSWASSSDPRSEPGWTLDDSHALMRHLAAVQRGAESLPLLAGLPDHGPEWVLGHLPIVFSPGACRTGEPGGLSAEEAGQFLALRPWLEAALHRLAASPIARTLGHGDLHEGNGLRLGANFTLLAWSDASLSHPFLDGGPQYLVPHDHRREVAETYLEAWAEILPLPELRLLLRDGQLAGELYRALGYLLGIQLHVAPDDHDWEGAHLYHFRALLRLWAELPAEPV